MASRYNVPHDSLRTAAATLCLALLTACSPKDDGAPPECEAVQPGVSAAFDYLEGWHKSGDGFTDCDVDSVTIEAGTVVTTLTCGAETAVIKTAVAIEGPPAWQVGDAVRLRTRSYWDPDLIAYDEYRLELRLAADDSLLILGVNNLEIPAWGAPFTVEVSHPCGPEVGPNIANGPVSLHLDFKLADASLGLIHGHRGSLPIDGTQSFAIDVEVAQGDYSLHGDRWHHFLIRRVVAE